MEFMDFRDLVLGVVAVLDVRLLRDTWVQWYCVWNLSGVA
jgi:hypothetical protein